jgi:hypothetical protein
MTTTIPLDGFIRQHDRNGDVENRNGDVENRNRDVEDRNGDVEEEKHMNTDTLVRTAEPVAPARPGWLRRAWLRMLRTVQEMNYANRRLIETQAPWSVDPQWHRR